jgi:hypothetical protein
MKTMLSLPIVLFAAALVAADLTLPPSLTTIKGKTYTGVHLKSVDPDGIRILHDGGAAKIKMEDLPATVAALFHFEAAKGLEYRRAQEEAQRATIKAINDKRAELADKDNKESAREQKVLADQVRMAAEQTQAAAALRPPAPTQGMTYTVTEIKAAQKDLDGQVVRVNLAYNSASAPEQQEDGSLRLYVDGSANSDFVDFPREGAAYVGIFLSSSTGQMTFYGKVRFGKPTLIIGRGYDRSKNIYTW